MNVYANDTFGNTNFTESIIFTYRNNPSIEFQGETTANDSTQTNTDIFVNISSSDLDFAGNEADHYTFVDFGMGLGNHVITAPY